MISDVPYVATPWYGGGAVRNCWQHPWGDNRPRLESTWDTLEEAQAVADELNRRFLAQR